MYFFKFYPRPHSFMFVSEAWNLHQNTILDFISIHGMFYRMHDISVHANFLHSLFLFFKLANFEKT